eukprot:g3632.t1
MDINMNDDGKRLLQPLLLGLGIGLGIGSALTLGQIIPPLTSWKIKSFFTTGAENIPDAQNDPSPSRNRYPTCPQVQTIRLKPGDDLCNQLISFIKMKQYSAVTVVSCVGSLKEATLRLANASLENKNPIITHRRKFEIVSLVGTLAYNPKLSKVEKHLHLALADAKGNCIGGHVLTDKDGKNLLPIYTTAEITLLVNPFERYERAYCPESGWPELVISPQ